MSADSAPALAIVIATPDNCDTIRRTLAHLRAQTARGRLELVVVCPSAASLGLEPADVEGLASYQVVEVGPLGSVAEANAAGVLRARAPLVALAENHSFPNPGWAAALIAAHEGPWAAVGPAMENANPASAVSWASFLLAYGRWLGAKAGPIDDLPGHNSSYKRALLVARGKDLDAELQAETALHQALLAEGHGLYLEPAAVTAHMNPSLLPYFLTEMLYAGRRFAATRARRWPAPRRLAYACGAALIPAVRLWRLFPQYRQAGRHKPLPRGTLPVLLVGLATSAWGEMLGYAFGPGRAAQELSDMELHRGRYVAAGDRLDGV